MKGISLSKEDILKEKAYQVYNKAEAIKCFGYELEDDFDTSSKSGTVAK